MSTGTTTCSRRFEPLVERLRAELHTRRIRPGALVGSEKALARETGLSRNSVRLAVSHLVKEGLLERRPGRGIFARDVKTVRHTVQIIVWTLEHDLWAKMVRGAKVVAREKGVEIQVMDVHMNQEQDIAAVDRLPSTDFQGAIIGSMHEDQFTRSLYRLHDAGYPFVLVDQHLAHTKVPSVASDNYGGGYAVGSALVKLGHRRIAFIGEISAQTVQQRLAGLRDAVMDAGIPFDRRLVFDNPHNVAEQTERFACEAMQRSPRPTAIFFSNDFEAGIGMRALRRMELRVPADVSIVGFDDNPLCELLDPPLATVRQDGEKMGAAAMEMLLERIGPVNVPKSENIHQIVPCQWVMRDSVGPAPV